VAAAAAKDVASLGVGAMFHDIGLLKVDPAALAAWEQQRDEKDPVWRQHVKLGFSLVHEHLDAAAAAVVLHHHQRFDGSGFPSRMHLSGKEIPVAGSHIHIFARIAAVADVFDALTSKRPYKKAWSLEDAVAYLQEHRGNHFDPVCVDGFLQDFPEVIKIYEKFQED
jgi:response regulator RpfG family c-di-GMP phosphodiesterase